MRSMHPLMQCLFSETAQAMQLSALRDLTQFDLSETLSAQLSGDARFKLPIHQCLS